MGFSIKKSVCILFLTQFVPPRLCYLDAATQTIKVSKFLAMLHYKFLTCSSLWGANVAPGTFEALMHVFNSTENKNSDMNLLLAVFCYVLYIESVALMIYINI